MRTRALGMPAADDDLFTVEHLEGAMIVRHFPPGSRRACCKLRVVITDEDRASSFPFEDITRKGSTAALSRANRAIEKKHEAKK